MGIDIMAIGIHPDDLEIGIFGTLAKSSMLKKSILLVDLTAGEMGSNGTVEIRKEEAKKAAEIIGAIRICLELPDRGIVNSAAQISEVVKCIRKYKPSWILYPYYKDYHPDHEVGSRLVKEAIHSAGLIHYLTEEHSEPHRPQKTAMYYINDVESANLYIDISEVIEKKIEGLKCHRSQFFRTEGGRETYLNNQFIEQIISRDAYHGMICKKRYAEALQLSTPPILDSLGGCLE